MKVNVEPKLKFEVGEEVIICGSSSYGNIYWPNKDEFTFTTIKEVKKDGSVVVEEGYKFRQAYKTQYGFTNVFDYFRVDRAGEHSKFTFNNKQYERYSSVLYRVDDKCIFYWGPVYLFKKTKDFEDKMIEFQKNHEIRLEKERQAQETKAIKDAKEKPFKDAYNEVVNPLKEEYQRKLAEAWKEYFCKSCKHNCNGNCTQWNHEISTASTSTCSAWEVK